MPADTDNTSFCCHLALPFSSSGVCHYPRCSTAQFNISTLAHPNCHMNFHSHMCTDGNK